MANIFKKALKALSGLAGEVTGVGAVSRQSNKKLEYKQQEQNINREKERIDSEIKKRQDLLKSKEDARRRSEIDKRRTLLKSRAGNRTSLYFMGNKLGVSGENIKTTLG